MSYAAMFVIGVLLLIFVGVPIVLLFYGLSKAKEAERNKREFQERVKLRGDAYMQGVIDTSDAHSARIMGIAPKSKYDKDK